MKKTILLILSILISINLLCGCGQSPKSIVGTWSVEKYLFDNEEVMPNEIADYLGENAEFFNDYTFTFTPSGNVVFKHVDFYDWSSIVEDKLAYTMKENMIELYDPDDSSDFTLLEYNNNRIHLDTDSGFIIVFKKN